MGLAPGLRLVPVGVIAAPERFAVVPDGVVVEPVGLTVGSFLGRFECHGPAFNPKVQSALR
jgi:hypothetical protein